MGLVIISAQLTDREQARICRGLAREAIARDLPRLLEVRRSERLPWQLPAAGVVALASPRLLHAIVRPFRRR